jgi:hypothetical protein
MKLNELGLKYRCDKSDIYHTFKGETYLDVYQTYFEKFRDKPVRFLELGVREGASIKIWDEFFTNSDLILGLDIMEHCKMFSSNTISIEIGSQGDEEFLKRIIASYAPFDIVLDDASHINELSVKSFNLLSPHVRDGGYYIIEDLRNSYEDLTEDVKSWPGMHLNKGINFNNAQTRESLDDTLLSVVKDLDYRRSSFKAVHFHSQMVILQK